MPLATTISNLRYLFQDEIFPAIEDRTGRLSEKHRRLIAVLDCVKVETFFPACPVSAGRPTADRVALATAFIAKSIWDLPTTRHLIDRILSDPALRRMCGWSRCSEVPSEATFSRAFALFAEGDLPGRMHEALIRSTLGRDDVIVGHLSRDSTAIEVREKPAPKKKEDGDKDGDENNGKGGKKGKSGKRKPGRPPKGESSGGKPGKEPERRLERQLKMSFGEMMADLPRQCGIGTKRNARGFLTSWKGYKLHIDGADGGIPVSCILTSASLHDSQAAIPLAAQSDRRVTACYEVMDSAYDAPEIRTYSESLGHVPIIDINPRRDRALKESLLKEARAQRAAGHVDHKTVRYRERSNIERINGRLKDEFGGRHVRVRGPTKVNCHLMWGILALTVDQLLRLGT